MMINTGMCSKIPLKKFVYPGKNTTPPLSVTNFYMYMFFANFCVIVYQYVIFTQDNSSKTTKCETVDLDLISWIQEYLKITKHY